MQIINSDIAACSFAQLDRHMAFHIDTFNLCAGGHRIVDDTIGNKIGMVLIGCEKSVNDFEVTVARINDELILFNMDVTPSICIFGPNFEGITVKIS